MEEADDEGVAETDVALVAAFCLAVVLAADVVFEDHQVQAYLQPTVGFVQAVQSLPKSYKLI